MANKKPNPISHYQSRVDKVHARVNEIGFSLIEIDNGEWEHTFQILDGENVIFTTRAITLLNANPMISAFVEGYKYRDKEAWEI